MKRTLVTALFAVAAVAAGSIAYAAIPSGNGVISACKTKDGAIKLIDKEAGEGCPGSQQLVEWNQQGPAGPQGVPGPSAAAVAEGGVGMKLGSVPKTLVTLRLSPGNYLFFGKVKISDETTGDFKHLPGSTSCWLAGGGAFDTDEVETNADDAVFNNAFDVGTLVLMAGATPSEDFIVRIECLSLHDVESKAASITAIKVGTLTDQTS